MTDNRSDAETPQAGTTGGVQVEGAHAAGGSDTSSGRIAEIETEDEDEDSSEE